MTCDALYTVNVFDFESEFVDHRRTKTDKCHKLYKYYLSDPDLKTNFLQRQGVIEAFVHIILQDHKSSCVKNNVEDIRRLEDIRYWKICWAVQTEKKKYQWK